MKTSVFSGCLIDEKVNISNLKKFKNFKKGESIFNEGENAQAVFYIYDGKVKTLKKDKTGKEHIISFAKNGNLLGLHAIINDTKFNATAITLEDTSVCCISKDDFLNLIKEDKNAFMRVMKLLCYDADTVEKRVLSIKHLSVTQRLVEGLLLLQQTFGKDKNNFINISLKDIELSGLTSANKIVTRNLVKKMKEQQLIDVVADKISILNTNKLKGILRN
ncbi:MAG: Crp/Fnr family transcriptional regulator [Flavobacteriales bacterium]|nr:Crp/Fnr family transcriptional regulator [Flavobacteriales bacterium]